MSKITSGENQTKNLYLQRLVDGCIILLLSVAVLSIYEWDWISVHTSKENMLAIHFDMFGTYYLFVCVLFYFFVPNFFEFISGRRLMYRFTDKKQLPRKVVRILKVFILTSFVIFCSVMLADKYSRVEFYDNGSIIEYNKNNQVINEYTESDIDFVEIRTNHDFGRHIDYWTEAVIYLKDRDFVLMQGDYVTPDLDSDIERSLYGLSKVKENFSDKMKINTENIYVLLDVEQFSYNQDQAKRLCDIFEIDFDEDK